MRRGFPLFAAAVLTATTASLTVTATPGHAAAACPLGLSASADLTPPGGVAFTVCSGTVPSFDGAPLDVDVSIPDSATGPLPLMVMMHGWGNDKTDWESTTLESTSGNRWHWNNAWFTAQGYAVLTYTARGFHKSCGKDNGQPNYDNQACLSTASWTHLSDRRWEIHDTQYLAGLLADAGTADPQRVVATGESYGGGQSWLLALSQDKVMNPDGTLSPWTSPKGTPLHLATAVPQYTWTDLVQALMDNGAGSDGLHGVRNGDHTSPIGVEKQSYVDGLFALGGATAQYAPPGKDPTADLSAWYAAISAGEPYESNPTAQTALMQLRDFRSPYYMPVPKAAQRVPVYAIQGTTDPLFPAIQAMQQFQRLQRAQYPVWLTLADVGHSYADNPLSVWQAINTDANAWLSTVMSGGTPALPAVTAYTTQCVAGQTTVKYTASQLSGLTHHLVRFTSTATASTASNAGQGQEGTTADPIANAGCRSMSASTDPGVAAFSFPVTGTLTVLGGPVVHVTAVLTGQNAELAARLWDIDGTGKQTLVTRTVVRLVSGQSSSLAFELWPTAWQVQNGHTLKLELTQVDNPTWRPDNEPSSLALSNLQLTLPIN